MNVTGVLETALDGADVVIVAVPAQHLRTVMTSASRWVTDGMLLVSVAKGIEVSSSMRMTEVLRDLLPSLSYGRHRRARRPNLALEVMAGHPSATRRVRRPSRGEHIVQSALRPTFRVYTSSDVVGWRSAQRRT